MSKLLVIGAGQAQVTGITRAREMGCSVVALDADPKAPGLALADFSYVVDIRDFGAVIAVAKSERVDGVCAFSVEPAIRTVAAVAEALGLAGPSLSAAMNATDKRLMREHWASANLPSPLSFPCYTYDDAESASRQIGYPLVIKPADSAGSRGVMRVDDLAGLSYAFEVARMHASNGAVLAESFMEGLEMSVEGFMASGRFLPLACSDKVRTDPPYLLDTTVLFPSEQPNSIQNSAIDIVGRAAQALGLDTAPVHAEVMVTSNGPMLVELAARGPGFKVFSTMLPWVTGVDGVAELIKMSLGEKIYFDLPKKRGAVLHFPSSKPGYVTRIDGVSAARSVKCISELEIYCRQGDVVNQLRSGADRIGHIIALAEARSTAFAAVREAEAALIIQTRQI